MQPKCLVRFFARIVGGLALLTASNLYADDWPQWLGPERDGVWREKGILDKFPANGPTERWRTPIGAGYGGPAVASGRVYVMDRITTGAAKTKKASAGKERVLCLDEANGKILWKHEYDCAYQVGYPAGPRVTPVIKDGRIYTLGTMGDLRCLDAVKGDLIWSKNFRDEYKAPTQQWGFSAHPLLDGDRLICMVGGKAGAVAAFHKDTGKEIWRALPGEAAGYCPPMIYEVGGTRQLIIWDPVAVHSLNPETGKKYWTSQAFPIQSALTIPTPRLAGNLLFVSAFYDGPLMLKLDTDKPGAQTLWKGKGKGEATKLTDGLHCLMSTPVIKDGYIYGICSFGQLRCLEASTGKRIWESFKATGGEGRWANAFLIPHEDRFFLFDERGNLILARLTPKGYDEIGRAKILEPTNRAAGRDIVWSHPAFANRSVYARNDKEIVCFSLAAP